MKALPAPWAMMMAKAINAQIMDTAAAGARAMTDSRVRARDRKSTRLNSSHGYISYAVFCLKKKKIRVDSLADAVPGAALPRPVLDGGAVSIVQITPDSLIPVIKQPVGVRVYARKKTVVTSV